MTDNTKYVRDLKVSVRVDHQWLYPDFYCPDVDGWKEIEQELKRLLENLFQHIHNRHRTDIQAEFVEWLGEPEIDEQGERGQ